MAQKSRLKTKRAPTKKDRDQEIVDAIMGAVDICEKDTTPIRTRWRSNYNQFVDGSVFNNKDDWQSNFSLNPYAADIRSAHGRLVKILIESADWYSIDPRSQDNPRANELNKAIGHFFDYYLEKSKFTRYASSFILSSLIGMGVMGMGWKPQLIMNPSYVERHAKKVKAEEQKGLSKIVENPESPVDDPESIAAKIEAALEKLPDIMAGEDPTTPQEQKIKPFLQVGCLDIQVPNSEFFYWDPNVTFMEDSRWNAAKTWMTVPDVRELGKIKYFNANAKTIDPNSSGYGRDGAKQRRYQGLRNFHTNKIEILYYYGPLIVDDEIKKDLIFAVIGNGSTLLKYTEYPYWEPPGQKTALIATSVRQVPHRATGQGIGDNAVEITRQYDANWQLICDQARLGIVGLNILDRTKLIEPEVADEALEPGKHIQCRGNPKEVFHHIDLTSNIENQVLPVQDALRSGIKTNTGVSDPNTGIPPSRSRTTAAEINAVRSGSADNVDMIAIDIEQGFLIPALEKAFARVIQFGLDELHTNPELQAVLSEEDFNVLSTISESERIEILAHFYKFKIRGFSGRQDKMEKLSRYNEFLTVVAGNPNMAAVVDPVKAVKNWMKLAEMEEEDIFLAPDNEFRRIISENEVLAADHNVEPDINDNHEMHMKIHGPLAMGSSTTAAAQMHYQLHAQMLQQTQQGQESPPIQ